jgi:ribulose-phosphate 3-epimerase
MLAYQASKRKKSQLHSSKQSSLMSNATNAGYTKSPKLKNKMEIIPTVFATTKKSFLERYQKLRKLRVSLHIDVMDGKFVKVKSPPVSFLPSVEPVRNAEAHLMVKNPGKYIALLRRKGIKKIIFHYESQRNKSELMNTIKLIKKNKLKCIIALNPNTPVQKIRKFINFVDGVLLMGVIPGKEHQDFIQKVYRKIKNLREFSSSIIIQVDGGINPKIAAKLSLLKVNSINIGSYIGSAENPRARLKELRNIS